MKILRNINKRTFIIFLGLLLGCIFIFYSPLQTTQASSHDTKAQARVKAEARASQKAQKLPAAKERAKARAQVKSSWLNIKRVMQHDNCANCHKIGSTEGSNSVQNQTSSGAFTTTSRSPWQ